MGLLYPSSRSLGIIAEERACKIVRMKGYREMSQKKSFFLESTDLLQKKECMLALDSCIRFA